MANQFVTAEQVLSLTDCPECGAVKEQKCREPNGEIHPKNHRERAKAARDILAMRAPNRSGFGR